MLLGDRGNREEREKERDSEKEEQSKERKIDSSEG
jgi:hypothetical protein